jgi:hypothetical protein
LNEEKDGASGRSFLFLRLLSFISLYRTQWITIIRQLGEALASKKSKVYLKVYPAKPTVFGQRNKN